MSELKQTFNSSLGKKLIMALTGLFLCTFIIVHLGGNLLLFKCDNGYAFNMYANFLTHFAPIEVVAYILYLCILVHALYAIILTTINRKSRAVGYAVKPTDNASWSSRNMGLLGTILFVFIVIHMSDFWYAYKYGHAVSYIEYSTDLSSGETKVSNANYQPKSDKFENSVQDVNDQEITRVKNLHARVSESFSKPWYVAIYVIAMVALSFHLIHGFQSAFRTLGWVHRKYTPIVAFLGTWFFGGIIPLGFALMPVVYYIMSLKK